MASTNLEQLVLELINDARLDPLGNVARYITSYSPLTATQANIQNNFDFFHVDGSALQTAFAALQAKQPLAWNDNLANGARLHDQNMVAVDQQTHNSVGTDPAGDPSTTNDDLGARFNGAGYTGWQAIGENIFTRGQDAMHIHAAFMVDWGGSAATGGMQSPPGHRDNIMGIDDFGNPIQQIQSKFREIGVGIIDANTTSNVGPEVVTEDFGGRGASGVFLLGVAYNDNDHNNFYSMGEGLGTLNVSISGGGGSTTSFASGGYVRDTTATGARTITFTGAGLAAAGTFVTTLADGQNIKLDVVDGHTLNTSVSGTVGGAFTTVHGLGVIGLNLTTGAGNQMLIGTKGSDHLDGGSGIDTAVYSANKASYTITKGAGSVTVSGLGATDTLTGIEKLQFADGTVSLEVHHNDFNGDGRSDLLFRLTGTTSDSNYEWQLNNRSLSGQGALDVLPKAYSVEATGDFNGDGKVDIVLQNPTTGGVWEWQLNGTTISARSAVDVGDPNYHLLGTGDLNGDGKDDLLFRNDAGFIYEWQMNGFANTPMPVSALDPLWKLQGTGDFNGDGRDDILLRKSGGAASENGAFYLWEMNGSTITAQGAIERPPTTWKTLGIGDFDGDGKDDFAVRNEAAGAGNGAVWVYLMNGTTIKAQGAAGIAASATWHLQEIGDFNGDGKDDILFRNNTGYFYSWDMNGTHIGSEGLLQGAAQWADPSIAVVQDHWQLV